MFFLLVLPLNFLFAYGAPSEKIDVLITVKTTKKYHGTRMRDIADTWFPLAPLQTFFVTDAMDETLQNLTGGHLIATDCGSGHHRKSLCCKQTVELELFTRSSAKWFCHFDDDNYVNIPRLHHLLSSFDSKQDWYLGKPSTKGPVTAYLKRANTDSKEQRAVFWFATGGAGYCISRPLVSKMQKVASGAQFTSLCDQLHLPDDVTIGFLIENLLNVNLTVINEFHSHLEDLHFSTAEELRQQVSLSSNVYTGDVFVPDMKKLHGIVMKTKKEQ